ncbi:putative membrane-associated, metal-dependent hydrolase, partial [Xanthomonas hortorum ATCC 19865]
WCCINWAAMDQVTSNATRRIERFKPVCKTADLGSCSRQDIVNAYDNSIGYTDHFLNHAIHTLRGLQDYDTAMIYVSDHGESLGEKGLYLHGVRARSRPG